MKKNILIVVILILFILIAVVYKNSVYSIPLIHEEKEFRTNSESYDKTMDYLNQVVEYIFEKGNLSLYSASLEGYEKYRYKDAFIKLKLAPLAYDSQKLINEIYNGDSLYIFSWNRKYF